MNRRQIINKILHDHIDVNKHEDYTNYKKLITAIEKWHESEVKNLTIPVVMPRILHFIDENGNNVDLNAAGVNAKLLRDGTFEYFISYGFAGRKELTPVYGA